MNECQPVHCFPWSFVGYQKTEHLIVSRGSEKKADFCRRRVGCCDESAVKRSISVAIYRVLFCVKKKALRFRWVGVDDEMKSFPSNRAVYFIVYCENLSSQFDSDGK